MADAHAKPHHDYHLVEPSPWPALGAVSAFVAAVSEGYPTDRSVVRSGL